PSNSAVLSDSRTSRRLVNSRRNATTKIRRRYRIAPYAFGARLAMAHRASAAVHRKCAGHDTFEARRLGVSPGGGERTLANAGIEPTRPEAGQGSFRVGDGPRRGHPKQRRQGAFVALQSERA